MNSPAPLFLTALALAAPAVAQFGPREDVGNLPLFGSFDQAFFDFSNDGDLDVFATSGDSVLFLRNDGLAGYASALPIATNLAAPRGLVSTDLDGDGDIDLVFCSFAGSVVQWIEQLPLDQWAAPQDVGPLPNAWQLEVRDLDQDGRLDVVASGHGQSNVRWFRQSSPGAFEAPLTVLTAGSPPSEVRIRDFNGDGVLDVAAGTFGGSGVIVALATSPGSFAAPVSIPVSASASELRGIVAEDFDLDGDVDLVYVAQFGGRLGLLPNAGNGVFSTEMVLDAGLENLLDVEAADLNADGYVDLVVAASGSSRIRWYFNGAFGFGAPNQAPEAGFAPTSVKVFDVDGDLDLDLFNAEGFFNPNESTIGTAGCVGEVNSTGVPGVLTATGLAVASTDAIALTATELPATQFTLLLAAQGTASVPSLGGGAGTLCLGGPIGRFNLLVASSDPDGAVRLLVDLDSVPTPSSVVSVQAGDTWYFQLWHRDVGAAGTTSNLTGAVGVSFQ